jgi:hypothetical protein
MLHLDPFFVTNGSGIVPVIVVFVGESPCNGSGEDSP